MKTAARIMAAYLLAALLLWLTGGFIVMEWNLTNWHPAGRFTIVWLSLLGIAVERGAAA